MAQRRRSGIFRHNPKIVPNQLPNTDEPINPQVAKEKSDSLRNQGCDLAKNGTPEDLKKAIEKFSEIKPLTDDIFYLRGNVHLKLGGPLHNQKAVNDFTEAIRLSNNSSSSSSDLIAESYYKRAFAHHMLGENDLAIRDYSLFIRYAKGKRADIRAKGFLSRGLVYESMQLLHKAFKDIDNATKLTHDKDPYYVYCRERVHVAIKEKNDDKDYEDTNINEKLQESESDEENEDDNKTFKQNEDQMSFEEQADSQIVSRTLNTEYQKVFYDALLLSEQGKNSQALEKFKNAFNNATNGYEKADSLFWQGLCQYELDDKVYTKNSFNDALKYNSKHARAHFRLGLIYIANDQFKDALNALNSANKYAPNDIDVLHERANVFEKLGRLNEAILDRRRTMELIQSPSNSVVILEDRIRHIKAEILQKGESAIRHFQIGWIQEALYEIHKTVTYFPEGKGKAREQSEQKKAYEEVIDQYKAAIETDVEHLCPEAHARLALFLDENKDHLLAHDSFQKLFSMFEKYPDFVLMWKSFVKNIKDTNYWIKMTNPPSESVLLKVPQVDQNRKSIDDDEKSFGQNKNLLNFYRTFRVQLSNVLAAIALAGCTKEVIAHNMQGSYSKVASIFSVLSKGAIYVPYAGKILGAAGNQTAKYLKDKDHELITNKLQMISNCGDLIEQNEIARRVARRLTDRYNEPLNRLDLNNEEIHKGCCSCCKSILPFIEPFDTNEPAKRVATFAVSYIISAVADQSIKTLKLKEANSQDSLVEMLVTLACRARASKIPIPKCYHDDPNLYLPLAPQFNTNLSTEKQLLHNENQNTTDNTNTTTSEISHSKVKRLDLYQFFRAPGLHYVLEEDIKSGIKDQKQKTTFESINEGENNQELTIQNDENQIQSNKCLTSNDDKIKIQHQNKKSGEKWSGRSYMNPEDYGYRLCSSIELQYHKEKHKNKVEHVCCTNSCC